MTSSIGLLTVFADLVILLGLVMVVASPALSQLARPLIAWFAFVCGWLVTAVFEALRAPSWTMFTGGGVIVASLVVMTVTLHLWTQGRDSGETGPGHIGDHGRGGPSRPRPDAPRHGDGGSDPSWWPEFERQFELYVALRGSERQPPVAPPARKLC